MDSRSRLTLALACLACSSAALAQESRAVFDAALVVADDEKRMEALIDFQNDSFVDALSYWWTDSTQTSTSYRLFALVNDGTGAFDVGWEVVHGFVDDGDYPALVAKTGDLNGDAFEDFVVFVDKSVHVYHSNGLSPPTLVQSFAVAYTGRHALADFDGDGLDDLALATSYGNLAVYMNRGASQGFLLELADTDVVPEAHNLIVGQLTGDGIPDLLTQELTGGIRRLRIHPMGADGTIGSPTVFIVPLFGDAMIGDIDGDGDEDVVVFAGSTFYVLRRTGPDSWTVGLVYGGGPGYALADVDADGDLDAICCGGGCCYYDYENDVQSTFHVSLNDGTGDFADSFTFPALGSLHIAGAADVDLDGDVDLVAGRTVYYAKGPITEHPWNPAGASDVGPRDIADFEGDGDVDLHVGAGSIHHNDATGAFMATPTGIGGVGPGYSADFDGDGDVDVITRGASGFPSIYRGDGAGGWLAPEPCAPPGTNFSFAGIFWMYSRNGLPADLDGDGDLDLLVMGRIGTPRETRVFLNDGTGFFVLRQLLPDMVAMGTGDFTSDGVLDLVVASGTSSSEPVGLLVGLGAGLFASTPIVVGSATTGAAWDELAVDDLNADGFLDVAVLDRGGAAASGLLRILAGDGAGGFTEIPPNVLLQGSGQDFVYAVDANGDGWSDLVASNTNHLNDHAFVLLRTPDGSGFEEPIIQMMHPTVLADMDADGDPDGVAHVFHTYDPKHWIENRTFEGDDAGGCRQYGTGFPGTGDCVPILGAEGPFRAGETARVHLLGGRGGSMAQLKVAFAESDVVDYPFRGMHAYAEPWFRRLVFWLDGPTGAPGEGRAEVEMVVPGALAGVTLYHQFYVLDPGSPYGWACSNGLEIRYR